MKKHDFILLQGYGKRKTALKIFLPEEYVPQTDTPASLDALKEYYTDFSMPSEIMARSGVYTDYIRMLLSSGKR